MAFGGLFGGFALFSDRLLGGFFYTLNARKKLGK